MCFFFWVCVSSLGNRAFDLYIPIHRSVCLHTKLVSEVASFYAHRCKWVNLKYAHMSRTVYRRVHSPPLSCYRHAKSTFFLSYETLTTAALRGLMKFLVILEATDSSDPWPETDSLSFNGGVLLFGVLCSLLFTYIITEFWEKYADDVLRRLTCSVRFTRTLFLTVKGDKWRWTDFRGWLRLPTYLPTVHLPL